MFTRVSIQTLGFDLTEEIPFEEDENDIELFLAELAASQTIQSTNEETLIESAAPPWVEKEGEENFYSYQITGDDAHCVMGDESIFKHYINDSKNIVSVSEPDTFLHSTIYNYTGAWQVAPPTLQSFPEGDSQNGWASSFIDLKELSRFKKQGAESNLDNKMNILTKTAEYEQKGMINYHEQQLKAALAPAILPDGGGLIGLLEEDKGKGLLTPWGNTDTACNLLNNKRDAAIKAGIVEVWEERLKLMEGKLKPSEATVIEQLKTTFEFEDLKPASILAETAYDAAVISRMVDDDQLLTSSDVKMILLREQITKRIVRGENINLKQEMKNLFAEEAESLKTKIRNIGKSKIPTYEGMNNYAKIRDSRYRPSPEALYPEGVLYDPKIVLELVTDKFSLPNCVFGEPAVTADDYFKQKKPKYLDAISAFYSGSIPKGIVADDLRILEEVRRAEKPVVFVVTDDTKLQNLLLKLDKVRIIPNKTLVGMRANTGRSGMFFEYHTANEGKIQTEFFEAPNKFKVEEFGAKALMYDVIYDIPNIIRYTSRIISIFEDDKREDQLVIGFSMKGTMTPHAFDALHWHSVLNSIRLSDHYVKIPRYRYITYGNEVPNNET